MPCVVRGIPFLVFITCIFFSICLPSGKCIKDDTVFRSSVTTSDIVIVVLSQQHSYHVKIAEKLQSSIIQQSHNLKLSPPVIYLIHEHWKDLVGAWTVFPLLHRLAEAHGNNSFWIFFCEEITHVDLKNLLALLGKYDTAMDYFLGHALKDREPTIIHHFAFSSNPSSFSYPDFSAGFLISTTLLKKLAKRRLRNRYADFSIDPKHELAKFVWDEGRGSFLQHVPQLCLLNRKNDCASWITEAFPLCGLPVQESDVFFAVKTCSEFHKDRVPVVQETWARETNHLVFYSDSDEPSIPTVNLGVPNVPHGHCAKTLAIISEVVRNSNIREQKWIVIADDDTLLSVSRLRKLLSCYNSSSWLALGERYGYLVAAEQGYDYITGGGGMVFSMPTMKLLTNSECSCPSNDSPDDMVLGLCLKQLGISITHSSLFHQARPTDYAPELLAHQKPISFHKHWMNDPRQVYQDWLIDKEELQLNLHSEL